VVARLVDLFEKKTYEGILFNFVIRFLIFSKNNQDLIQPI